MLVIELAAVTAPMQIPNFKGNISAAAMGAGILFSGFFMARYKILLYSQKATAKINKNRDWVSLISFLIGFTGITILIGAPRRGLGPISLILDNIQNVFIWLGETGLFAALGMWFICLCITLFAVKQAAAHEDDSVKDIMWGGLCGFAFPLGGVPFSSLSTTIANAVVEMMNGIPAS